MIRLVCISLALLQFSIPGLPGLGGNVAVKAAAKELAPYFEANQPIVRDWSAIFPTVDSLPNNHVFSPTVDSQRQLKFESGAIGQLHGSTQGSVMLAPGDYSLPVRLYCTDIHRHAKSVETYLLGPLRGTRAGVLTAFYANAGHTALDWPTLQPLSWSLQEGLKYEELPGNQQQAFDTVLPGWRSQIAQSFVELMQSRWSTISSTVPGVPSLDSALGQMGDMGRFIQDAEFTRQEIVSDASDFDALRNALVPGGLDSGASGGTTPWSVPAQNIFERVVTQGAYGSIGLLEIHVDGSNRLPVPVTSLIGYAPQCHECQPLTMHPLKGASP